MTSKDAVRYARELLKRGFTRDAAREILLSRGYDIKNSDDALSIASKPEKHISMTMLLGITIALIIILIPTVFLLAENPAKSSSSVETTQSNSLQNQPDDNVVNFECSIDEECLFDEVCKDSYCISLSCSSCESLFDHQCLPLKCSDENSCTSDYCSEGACFNEKIESCLDLDGCCPNSCNQTTDSDCISELTQLNYSCTSDLDCSDGNIGTIDTCIDENQTKKCIHTVPSCGIDDGLCPSNCTLITDNDCSSLCGNNATESGEECDGNCPFSQAQCNDNNTCTLDNLLGSFSLCTAECIHTNIVQCTHNDNCCPSGCVYSLDNDCPPASTKLATTSFTSVQRTAQGNVELYAYEDATHKIIFSSSFAISNIELNENLKVYLASKAIVTTMDELNSGNIELGPLKSSSGTQEYKITTFISDIESYKSIVIAHQSYNSIFAYASLVYN